MTKQKQKKKLIMPLTHGIYKHNATYPWYL